MKLFTLYNNNILTDNNGNGRSLIDNEAPIIATSPDTAVIKDGRPFFIPDFTKKCVYMPSFVIRISRLGHSISERFAHRYYDSITAGVRFVAMDLLESASAAGLPWSFSTGFDGSASRGQFVDAYNVDTMRLSLSEDGNEVFAVSGQGLAKTIDWSVAHISQFYTLRQGDLIFSCLGVDGFREAVVDSHISGAIDQRKVLAFNVK